MNYGLHPLVEAQLALLHQAEHGCFALMALGKHTEDSLSARLAAIRAAIPALEELQSAELFPFAQLRREIWTVLDTIPEPVRLP